MEVDAEIAVPADAVASLGAIVKNLEDALAGVVDGVAAPLGCGVQAKRTVAGFDGKSGALFHAHAGRYAGNHAGCVVALAVIADRSAEDFMDRQLQHFAADVPQREIERTEGVFLFASRRIEERPRHILPEL